METIQIVLTVVFSIVAFVIYHQLFSVVYFDFSRGCAGEIIGCLLAGAVMAALVCKYWYISIPIVILLLVALFKRNE